MSDSRNLANKDLTAILHFMLDFSWINRGHWPNFNALAKILRWRNEHYVTRVIYIGFSFTLIINNSAE